MPRPWTNPRVKVVFPAPKGPVSETTVPGATSVPNRRAKRWVSASPCTTTVHPETPSSPGLSSAPAIAGRAPPVPASGVFPAGGFRSRRDLSCRDARVAGRGKLRGKLGGHAGSASARRGLAGPPAACLQRGPQRGQRERLGQDGCRAGSLGFLFKLLQAK